MGQTREQRIIKQVVGKPTVERVVPIATGMIMPNHSGIATHPEFKKSVSDNETDPVFTAYLAANPNKFIDWTNTTQNFTTTGTLDAGDTTVDNIIIETTAKTGRETLIKANVTDVATDDMFAVINATATSGKFTPLFLGNQETEPGLSSLYFTAQSDADGDTGTAPYMTFSARSYPNSQDPLNPVSGYDDITTRPLFKWRNNVTTITEVDKDGNWDFQAGNLTTTGNIQGNFKSSDGSAGLNTTFTNGDGDTVTVKDGLITDIS